MRRIVFTALMGAALLMGNSLQAGPPIPPDTFRALGGSGSMGDTLSSMVEFDNVNIVQGWSFGLCHDGANLMLNTATESSLVMTINGGNAAGFLSLDPMPSNGDGVTMGVVIDLFGINTLAPGMNQPILDLSYTLIGDPTIMGADIVTDACFCDTIGVPTVATVSVVDGASIPPITECGTFTIAVPPPGAQFSDFTCVGGPDNADLSWTVSGGPFDYILVHRNGEFLAMLGGDSGMFSDPGLVAGSYHYSLIAVEFMDPMGSPTITVVECDVEVIPLAIDDDGIDPIIGPYTGGTLVTITGTGFLPPEMDTTVELDGVTQAMITVIDDNTLTFVTQSTMMLGLVDVTVSNSNGTATLVDGFEYAWIRGDSNSDGAVDLADAIFIFSFLFENGTTPACLDAADDNDDGGVNIADPVYLISFLFEMGPVPLAPFPDAGSDPTADGLDCLGVL